MGPTRRVRMSPWAARTNLTHPAAPGPRRCLAKRQPIPGGNEQLRSPIADRQIYSESAAKSPYGCGTARRPGGRPNRSGAAIVSKSVISIRRFLDRDYRNAAIASFDHLDAAAEGRLRD